MMNVYPIPLVDMVLCLAIDTNTAAGVVMLHLALAPDLLVKQTIVLLFRAVGRKGQEEGEKTE